MSSPVPCGDLLLAAVGSCFGIDAVDMAAMFCATLEGVMGMGRGCGGLHWMVL